MTWTYRPWSNESAARGLLTFGAVAQTGPEPIIDDGLASVAIEMSGTWPSRKSSVLGLTRGLRKSHTGEGVHPLHAALTQARNTLSQDSGPLDPGRLTIVAEILKRAVHFDAIRLLGATSRGAQEAKEEEQRGPGEGSIP